jgi:hypothetical protein
MAHFGRALHQISDSLILYVRRLVPSGMPIEILNVTVCALAQQRGHDSRMFPPYSSVQSRAAIQAANTVDVNS